MTKNRTLSLNSYNIPSHVVIIMDGNGRWAKKNNLHRISGHKEGMKSVRSIIHAAKEFGIKYLTLYAFSEQNWNRPKSEVLSLMDLLKLYLMKEGNRLLEENIKLNSIGRLASLPDDVLDVLNETIDNTCKCTDMTLTLALSYGGREEIIDAVKEILRLGNINEKTMSEEIFSKFLYTHDLPDPDLLIRTSGEIRISNFLLWQLAYTEIYVTKTLWPDFRRRHLIKALQNYQKRERRYGLTTDQVTKRNII